MSPPNVVAYARNFQRAQFSRHSERLDADQLQLALEEHEIASAHTQAAAEKQTTAPRPRAASDERKSRPAHLPPVEIVIEPETTSCRFVAALWRRNTRDR